MPDVAHTPVLNSGLRLVQAHAVAPAVGPWVDHNAVGEGVGVAGCNWWNMIFVFVNNVENLECSFLEHISHCLADLGALCQMG